MKLVSLNIGLPREVSWQGKTVTTGIFKQPISQRIMLRFLNLDGDRQADLTVHGGPEKAVYAYPVENYDYWRKELPDMELPWGMFGESLTTMGLLEDSVNIGDCFRIGAAELMVTQPRRPCYKLGIKFGRGEIVKRFKDSNLPGIYFSVMKEGEVGVGDEIELIHRDENNVTVADINRLYFRENVDLDLLHRAVKVKGLAENLRRHFQQQIDNLCQR